MKICSTGVKTKSLVVKMIVYHYTQSSVTESAWCGRKEGRGRCSAVPKGGSCTLYTIGWRHEVSASRQTSFPSLVARRSGRRHTPGQATDNPIPTLQGRNLFRNRRHAEASIGEGGHLQPSTNGSLFANTISSAISPFGRYVMLTAEQGRTCEVVPQKITTEVHPFRRSETNMITHMSSFGEGGAN